MGALHFSDYSLNPKMDTACSSKKPVNIYQTGQCHITEDSNIRVSLCLS
jgi:hypothetical protein